MSGIVWDWDRCWVHAQRFAYVVACLLKAGAMGGAYKCDRRSLLFLSPEKRGGGLLLSTCYFPASISPLFSLTDWLTLSLSLFFLYSGVVNTFSLDFWSLKAKTRWVVQDSRRRALSDGTHSGRIDTLRHRGGSGSQSGSPFRSPRLCEFGKLVAFAASWIVTL